MKASKVILIAAAAGVWWSLYAINPRDINDTSNVRISSPELRAELLTNLMKRRLDLDNATAGQLKTINLKCEEYLQQLVLESQPILGRRSARGAPDKFDQLAAQRDEAYKKILGRQYALFAREQFALRNELKKQILAHYSNIKKQEDEQKKAETETEAARKAADLAARQKAYQDQKALEAQKKNAPANNDKADKKSKKKKKDKKGKKKKKSS